MREGGGGDGVYGVRGGGARGGGGAGAGEEISRALAVHLHRRHLHARLRAVAPGALRVDAREQVLRDARDEAPAAADPGRAAHGVGFARARGADGDDAGVVALPRRADRGRAHVAVQALLRVQAREGRRGRGGIGRALDAVDAVERELLRAPRVGIRHDREARVGPDADAPGGRGGDGAHRGTRAGVRLGVRERADAHRDVDARRRPVDRRAARRHRARPGAGARALWPAPPPRTFLPSGGFEQRLEAR